MITTYQYVASKGTPITAVAMWMCCQFFNSHVTRAKRAISIAHEGTATTQVRHRARVNSDITLYCTVSSNPIARPMKKRTIANINHDVENAASMLNMIMANNAKKSGCFRPTRSATCPHARLPSKTPPIWMDVIAEGIHALSQIRSHWKNMHIFIMMWYTVDFYY